MTAKKEATITQFAGTQRRPAFTENEIDDDDDDDDDFNLTDSVEVNEDADDNKDIHEKDNN